MYLCFLAGFHFVIVTISCNFSSGHNRVMLRSVIYFRLTVFCVSEKLTLFPTHREKKVLVLGVR